MPRVPYPDPLYPVVWADTPDVPDSPPTPTVSGLADDDDPIQLHLDEALVRKADNDTVDRWKAFSGPWFDARGEEAAARWKEIEQGLHEIVRRPLGELVTTRQRNMYRDIMEPRLSAWGDEARAHADRETQAFNDSESRQRQDLALAAMRRGARLNDMHAVAEGERRIIGEVRGRSRRQGLDPDAASAAEADALGAAYADLVEHLAQHDPQRAQDWLNARAATIGDLAKVDRLHGMLQPYVAEQQQEGLADLIRDEGGDLPAQHAAVDAMGLDPAIADGLKQRLADMAARDRKATEAKQTVGPVRLSGGSQDGTHIPSPEYHVQPPHYEQLPDGRWVFGRYEGTPGSGEAHFQEYEDPDLTAWKNTTSFAVDMLPALGSAKSVGQIITGKDLVTGEPINRSVEAANLALSVLPGGKILGRVERKVAEKEGYRVLFGQRRVSERFSSLRPDGSGPPDHLAGRLIRDVADDLIAGRLHPDQLPIEAFRHGDHLVSANTRILSALSEAGMKPTKIKIIEPDDQLLKRLREQPIIRNAPLPGPLIPVTRPIEIFPFNG